MNRVELSRGGGAVVFGIVNEQGRHSPDSERSDLPWPREKT